MLRQSIAEAKDSISPSMPARYQISPIKVWITDRSCETPLFLISDPAPRKGKFADFEQLNKQRVLEIGAGDGDDAERALHSPQVPPRCESPAVGAEISASHTSSSAGR